MVEPRLILLIMMVRMVMMTIMMMRRRKHMMDKTMVVTKDVKSMVAPMLTMVLMIFSAMTMAVTLMMVMRGNSSRSHTHDRHADTY